MSMFYEAVGALLSAGGAALSDLAAGGQPGDARTDRDLRQIALLMRRIAEIWPDLFVSLHREIELLEAADAALAPICAEHGILVPQAGEAGADPLRRYRDAQRRLESAIGALHAHAGEDWADTALRGIRRSLADAAAVQGELVDRALAAGRAGAS